LVKQPLDSIVVSHQSQILNEYPVADPNYATTFQHKDDKVAIDLLVSGKQQKAHLPQWEMG
jgi:hypothetical protein